MVEPTQFSCKAEKNKGLFVLSPKPGELKRFPEDPKGYAFQICVPMNRVGLWVNSEVAKWIVSPTSLNAPISPNLKSEAWSGPVNTQMVGATKY